jgi:molybdenum cofactor cytidylyltransferase
MRIGLLLAAGRSTRFGRDKRFECLPDDTPIVLASAMNLKPAVDRLFVAIHEEDQALEALLTAAEMEFFVCPDALEGMGNSIANVSRQVLQKLSEEGQTAHQCVLALADMPFIHPSSYQRIVEALEQGASIVRPEYHGHTGHPVGFAAHWWPSLLELNGEQGARDLIASHKDQLTLLACDDPGVVLDIDRPEDLFPLDASLC